jgi:hypothetical protein
MDVLMKFRNVFLLSGSGAIVVFLALAVVHFLESDEPFRLRDRNWSEPLLSGIIFGLLVEFDYLIPHATLVVTIFGFLILGAAVAIRYRS